MRFAPVQFATTEELIGSFWNKETGEGISVRCSPGEYALGEEIILQVSVTGAPITHTVRGTVVWKREKPDAQGRMPAGIGVRFHPGDQDRVQKLLAEAARHRRG